MFVWQSVSLALKGLEAKHQADKLIQEQKQVTERAKAAQAAKAQEAVLTALKSRAYQLQEALQAMLAEAWALKTGTRQPSKGHSGAVSNPAGSGETSSVEQAEGTGSEMNTKAVSIALSDYGAGGGGAGTVSMRWLYLHQQAGPWVTMRAVLKEATASGGASTSRSEASVTGEYDFYFGNCSRLAYSQLDRCYEDSKKSLLIVCGIILFAASVPGLATTCC